MDRTAKSSNAPQTQAPKQQRWHLLQSWPDWKWTAVGAVTYFLFPAGMFVVAYLPSYWLALGFAVLWGWGAAVLWGDCLLVREPEDSSI